MDAKYRSDKIIEEICMSHKVKDLWGDVISPNWDDPFIRFTPDSTLRIRLLGPILEGRSFYLSPKLNLIKYLEGKEIYDLIRHNLHIEELHKRIYNSCPDIAKNKLHVESFDDINPMNAEGQMILQILNTTSRIQQSSSWKNVTFSNAVFLNGEGESNLQALDARNPSIVVLNGSMKKSLAKALSEKNEENAKKSFIEYPISGLHAYDLNITRNGEGLKTQYSVSLSKNPYSLSFGSIELILREQLWDIKKIIKQQNKKVLLNPKRLQGFIYRLNSDYKIPNSFIGNVSKEKNEEKNELDQDEANAKEIEKKLHELPSSLLGENKYQNTIGSLEI